ncbi:MAG TPA: hypothetical protein PKI94_06980 [Candidatus Gastranaerophilaceae bacterium]|nr:hypothetical protein [Candidatus Gastranaerophilaceae bacterium]
MNVQIKNKFYFGVLILIFLLGFFLRAKGLLSNPSMWHDESALAWNVKFKSYFDLLCAHLRFLQIAPPLFMVFAKLMTWLFGVTNTVGEFDFVVRLIPFLFSILSVFVFYFILKDVFNMKKTIIFAMFLFAINNVLVNYSFEFKPYCSDMFFVMLVLLIFLKIDFLKINLKKILLISMILSSFVWFSFVSLFAIGAGLIYLIFKKTDFKRISVLFLPFLLNFLLYSKIYLLGAYINNKNGMVTFWADKFISADFSNFIYLFSQNITYFFIPLKSALFIVILALYGIFIFVKEKRFNFVIMALLIFSLSVASSILHIYPFSQRLIIFFIPLIIIFISKPLDQISLSKKVKSIMILMLLFFITFPQIKKTSESFTSVKINKGHFGKEMMQYLAQNIKPDDIILFNSGSNADFYYYSSFYNLKNKFIQEKVNEDKDEAYLKFLQGLKKGNYWFFMPYDYTSERRVTNCFMNWAYKNQKVLSKAESTRSVLMYVKIR